MKRLELLPTEDNITKCFLDDSINRNKDILSFVTMLSNIEGSYSIAIDNAWGSGKTFFVKQTKLVLDSINPHSNKFEYGALLEPVASVRIEPPKSVRQSH